MKYTGLHLKAVTVVLKVYHHFLSFLFSNQLTVEASFPKNFGFNLNGDLLHPPCLKLNEEVCFRIEFH